MFEVPLLGARALFTTRLGGASTAPFDSRNLGLFTDDDKTVVRQNIDQLKADLDLPTLQLLHQVHGGEIEHVSSATTGTIPIADGAITTERLHGLLITGADCPAVMLASENRLAALHCGWRPVAAGIIEDAVAHFNGEEFHAAIGPGICQKHFEVGQEVVDATGVDGPAHAIGRQLDLRGIIETRLKRAGAANVHVINRCTHCQPEYFFSHRRDNGMTGRQAGVAWRV